MLSSDMDEQLLLQRVSDSPDDIEAHLVYADYLLSRGEPLGELITLACSVARAPNHQAWRRSFKTMLTARETALLGGSADIVVRWHLGLVRNVVIRARNAPDAIRRVLSAPECRAMRRITLTTFGEAMAESLLEPGLLPATIRQAVLQSSHLGDDFRPDDVGAVLRAMPALRHLSYKVDEGLPFLPALVDLNAIPQDALLAQPWPALTRLRLMHGMPGVPAGQWLPALDAATPRLLHLRLHGRRFQRPTDWLSSSLIRRLKSFECGMPLTTQHVDAIEAQPHLYEHLDDFVLAGRRIRHTPNYRAQWEMPDGLFWR